MIYCDIDHKEYETFDEVPDYGNWQCVETKGDKVTLQGLFSEVDKLPLSDNLAFGSSAMCLDTGDVLFLFKTKDDGLMWKKFGGGE